MALKLCVTAQAKRDTGRILGYIAKDNPDAAAKLADAIEHGIMGLLEHPLSAPVVPNQTHPDIRQLIIPPCRILHRVAGQNLYIIGILRCEQDIERSEY